MYKFLKNVVIASLPLVLLATAYASYLATGGQIARNDVKSLIKRLSVSATYTLTADNNGGDCAKIGIWEDGTSTCKLTDSLALGDSIYIKDSFVKLDGNNQTMEGDGNSIAIHILGSRGVEVYDLKIRGYKQGIFMQNATLAKIRNIDITQSEINAMVMLGGSNYNLIEDNRVSHSGLHGINVGTSHGNRFIGNYATDTRDGIRLQNSHGNIFIANFFEKNRIEGLDFHSSTENLVFYNRYVDEEIAVISDLIADVNRYQLDFGGNEYSAYDEPEEGCEDKNSDGFCDAPYKFDGVIDTKPLVKGSL
ncbi:MAG: right-handed parallel beta-helix repeat-containing protein [Gammaproteobacteria bacterium]|nr:right-handed parallel beta-helix repeat-containing protein [Gammaproteobacteria bacterium]